MAPKTHAEMRRDLLFALDMMQDGFALYQAKLRREHPDASADEIMRMFRAWLLDRAPDTPGRVRSNLDEPA